MLFNSFEFLLFFPIVTGLYFLLPHRFRWIHLLIASCVFYIAFIPVYIFILFFLIIIDYIAGRAIQVAAPTRKKQYLILSIVANLGVLAFFKYYNFFSETIESILGNAGLLTHPLPYLGIILPIGLSFHTFQAMSYTIEVYRGNQQAERHLGIYALYVMFYPQLSAGPIERPQHMLHQLKAEHFFSTSNLVTGLRFMLWGFFMKLVVADRLGLYVNAIYEHPREHNGNTLLLATFFFAFQIYGDFAGYSLIALGSARTMGFSLMQNFRRPYFSKSITEFWTRWHISMTTWFRDYVFIQLGGSRVALPRIYLNLLIVSLLTGLWHGPSWTFVIWGGLNGVFLIGGLLINRSFPHISNPTTGWSKTIAGFTKFSMMVFLFMIARVFFRAKTVDESWFILKKIFADRGSVFIPQGRAELVYCWLALIILFAVEAQEEFLGDRIRWMQNKNVVVRYAVYAVLTISILALGVFDGGQFIYFQF